MLILTIFIAPNSAYERINSTITMIDHSGNGVATLKSDWGGGGEPRVGHRKIECQTLCSFLKIEKVWRTSLSLCIRLKLHYLFLVVFPQPRGWRNLSVCLHGCSQKDLVKRLSNLLLC